MLDIKTFLLNVFQIKNPSFIEKAEQCAEFLHVNKGVCILHQGEPIGSYRFLASEGIIRCAYHTNSGKEITECFIHDIGGCAIPSAVMDEPSPVDMEALTDVDLICFPIETVKKLEIEYPEILALENKLLTLSWRFHWEIKRVHYELSAKERYLWFLERYPNTADYVHDKDIASFLDMSPVTLSRIRSQLAAEHGGEK